MPTPWTFPDSRIGKSQRLKHLQGGFGLIELMVAMFIIVLLTTVMLVDYNKFNGRIVLDNLTSDLALEIRQTQANALGVRQVSVAGARGYGVHFVPASNTYIIYGDFPDSGPGSTLGDYLFRSGTAFPASCGVALGTAAADTECLDIRQLLPGYQVQSLSVTTNVPATYTPTFLDVTFTRPDPDAKLMADDGASPAVMLAPDSVVTADIVLAGPKGNTRTIRVRNTGQISVF